MAAPRPLACVVALTALSVARPSEGQGALRVGPRQEGGTVVATSQLIRPAGRTLEIAGRPVDLALSPDGATLYAKDNRGLVVIDVASWAVTQELGLEDGGGSMTGLAVSADGSWVYATTSRGSLVGAAVGPDGVLTVAQRIALPGPGAGGVPYPCGVALSRDGRRAFVCLSRCNTLAVVDLAAGTVEKSIGTGIAPYAVVLSPDGGTAYTSNWGGRPPREGDATAPSSGTPVKVDERGVAAGGSVSVIDLGAAREVAQVDVGLSPCGLALSRDAAHLFVANANSDVVSVIDTASRAVIGSTSTRPRESLPFGSMPNALSVSPDGARLYAANAGNNALAVIPVEDPPRAVRAEGFIPTGWYPGAIVTRGEHVYVASIKGVGSRTRRPDDRGFNSHRHRGTVSVLDAPRGEELAALSAQVLEDARVPQMLRHLERAGSDAPPVAVPERPGERSVFEHVVYVIKENRTFDQVFGDMPRCNADPSLCIYGREVTPNQHALAEQFVLLDNFYCNGVLSADGHAWATEGNVTPYLERSFGGFARSYTFGDDPLSYSSSGFVWDHVLAAGYSFRNYGEFDYAKEVPDSSYFEVYKDWKEGTGRIAITHEIGVERVRRYSHPAYPGWNMDIPDVLRAGVFLEELAEFERDGAMPNFCVVYLPNDHTSGTGEGNPTPRSLVADNDLALGRIVQGLTASRFWKSMCILVIEDDPQDGFDHVDGHRSTCLVVSPYARRGETVSHFYNQASVIHTIERIFGITPVNQSYALAPVMRECFAPEPDFTPFACLPNLVPLAEPNPRKTGLGPAERRFAEQSEALALDQPDRADEDTLNRILWHAAKGADAPYPAHVAGAHGKGLAAVGLRLVGPNDTVVPDLEGEDEDE